MKWFKYSFCKSIFSQCFKNFCGFANIFLHIPVRMGNQAKKILSPLYSLWIIFLWSSKNYFVFASSFSFSNVHIINFVSTLPNIVKVDVVNDVISTLSNFIQIKVEIDSNVDVLNVVSTLIWRCVTSRHHINLKAKLKERLNVCWVSCLPYWRH